MYTSYCVSLPLDHYFLDISFPSGCLSTSMRAVGHYRHVIIGVDNKSATVLLQIYNAKLSS